MPIKTTRRSTKTTRTRAAIQTPRVLVADTLSEDGIKILKGERGLDVTISTGLSSAELAKVIKAYEGIIIRSTTKITAEIIRKADRLKVIGRAGVGLDNVDVPAATKRGILVMNVPSGNTIS